MKDERKEIFKEIVKVIDDLTDDFGTVSAKSLKKELLVEVFPEIPLTAIDKEI